ncbi:MAG TPA: glycerol-3-phosphate acyltransferase [Candidatus Paceibacterota bacterium]|nr:glycerol-3-phosphate acyltransferase [Verrucomicrobiota bacterium]HRY49885.1 glycerol-3-phosphate acyltransferase [Candidatus Paceibacterota bacterium]HSA03692.1 glycerol-3-phosphate acyltransferase [Candidatus Paceibacterota bacterium]
MIRFADVFAIAAAYGLGCFSAGYYLVRWRTGSDIRARGSGATGAKNVGRLLGFWGFAATFLIDSAKGALAVGLGRWLGVPPGVLMIVVLAVVIGHAWPVQLGFRGGKGIATALGAMAAHTPWALVGIGAVVAITYWMGRRFVLSGIIAFFLLSFMLMVWPGEIISGLGCLVLACLLALTHRRNLRQELTGLEPEGGLKKKGSDPQTSDEAHRTTDL